MHFARRSGTKSHETAREVSFDCVNQQDCDSGGFAEHAKCVRGADVATPNRPDVYAASFGDQISRWDRSNQVTYDGCQRKAQKLHAANLGEATFRASSSFNLGMVSTSRVRHAPC